ncbi:hypothetical protein UPYG_G00152450 [Umbra pygmaea]|uniref:Uncharacterized protein n=1 Tax=Umbra pygmaea TaxID=75934 RepID=A0ABD0WXA3_UMBPY
MEADIRKWVAQCPQCQSKRAHIKEKTQYNPKEVSEPLELVGMDLVGKLTLTDGDDRVNRLLGMEETSEGINKRESVYDNVKCNVQKSQDRVRKRKRERGQEDNFEVGDLVLRKNVKQELRKGGKQEANMLGPLNSETRGKDC